MLPGRKVAREAKGNPTTIARLHPQQSRQPSPLGSVPDPHPPGPDEDLAVLRLPHDAMTSRSSSITALRDPSLSSRRGSLNRRVSAISSAEQGEDSAVTSAEHAIHEEIAEIKRYEDFTTIDWVQDAAREQLRRKARRQKKAGFFERGGGPGWRHKLSDAYDAGQAWIVVLLVGAAIGLNAAFLNIVTEWLSDIKLGYCTTAFYLNEQFCCWGAENGRVLSSFCALCVDSCQAVRSGIIGAASGPSITSSTSASLRSSPTLPRNWSSRSPPTLPAPEFQKSNASSVALS